MIKQTVSALGVISTAVLISTSTLADEKDTRLKADEVNGMRVFNRACAECHYDGKQGAPRLNDLSDWKRRIFKGEEVLKEHALNGYLGMPQKGGRAELTDQDVIDAVHYVMVMIRDEPAR
jgi:cytochrome c5